ncbi:hypothetical protein BRAO375_2820016 [Bradyrhizobium sp. ORS 375]|nr:hypothetical protein BRAO375_2820016 [Bradyrhizobium sp. ORS 375]
MSWLYSGADTGQLRGRRHSGAIVNAQPQGGCALAIEPGTPSWFGTNARQSRDSGFKACGLAPE